MGSRKEVKGLIRSGRIQIDGQIVRDESKHISETAKIVLDNTEDIQYKSERYYALHKPAGVITSTEDKNHKTIMDILPDWVVLKNLSPVGRLDIDTEGLLVLTTNGDLAHRWLSPKSHVAKVYMVHTKDPVTTDQQKKLEQGVSIPVGKELYHTKPAKVEIPLTDESTHDGTHQLLLTLYEGKFHQVKLMLKTVGNEVVYLKRIQFGPIHLGDLKKGEIRELTEEEIQSCLDSLG